MRLNPTACTHRPRVVLVRRLDHHPEAREAPNDLAGSPGRTHTACARVTLMKLRLFQIDAFASRAFAGNPAAVVPLERWLDDATLQAIAAENNLSETAFFVGGSGTYEIRWMTPTEEVDLCGHATLASGWVVMNELEPGRREVAFRSKSGPLQVLARGERPSSRREESAISPA